MTTNSTTTITATPCGHDRHGNPLAARRYVVDGRREDWGEGRTRVFEHRPDLEFGDGMRFTPIVVHTDSIREEPHPTEHDVAAAFAILREFHRH
ncbi:hypothetical protein FOS14_19690 [Skermania sp. ID1734]|uniref:hypothetical protein n=1 Tax=Skermania sp. ID1734 TaxID=2597516 RepID=UPI00117EEC73|nr:hypothetical protein [Skermania sp. ID1734]TSD94866.1 hypothetical protein FOS14_19690 [Skermania sp. ID1734]